MSERRSLIAAKLELRALLAQAIEALDTELALIRQAESAMSSEAAGDTAIAPRRRRRHGRLDPSDVRDAFRKLEVFSATELAEYLGCAPAQARQQIHDFEKRGTLAVAGERHGERGRPARTYRFAHPGDDAPKLKQVRQPAPRRNYAGAGPRGGRPRAGHPEIDKLLAAAISQGFSVERTGSGHIQIKRGSDKITMPATPSDHRSVKNTKAQMRRAGIKV